MKKITLIILFTSICCAWGQEYIEINCERALNNGSSELLRFLILICQ